MSLNLEKVKVEVEVYPMDTLAREIWELFNETLGENDTVVDGCNTLRVVVLFKDRVSAYQVTIQRIWDHYEKNYGVTTDSCDDDEDDQIFRIDYPSDCDGSEHVLVDGIRLVTIFDDGYPSVTVEEFVNDEGALGYFLTRVWR